MRKLYFPLLLVGMFLLVGCSLTPQVVRVETVPTQVPVPTVIPSNLLSVETKTVIAKMVAQPSDRERDFTVIKLDGSYTVYYDPQKCQRDVQRFMYGPYDSVQHCEINNPSIVDGIIADQAWTTERLAPFRQYLNCINGWVYEGVDSTGRTVWFIEIFGFNAFC